MTLNYIWVGFFLVAFVIALIKLILFGDFAIFPELMKQTFEMSKTGFEISLGLTGIMTLWLGLMRVGEKGGIIQIFAKLIGPFFSKLFPEIPRDHPAMGYTMMNLASNMLGLDNAATPIGLKAMSAMQELNPDKETASNAQIMFLVINTSGLALIPITIMVYRAQLGAVNPADILIPTIIATFCAAMLGVISVAIMQKINLFNRVVLAYFGGLIAMIGGLIYYFNGLPQEQITRISSVASNLILFLIIISFILLAMRKKVNVYETFIEGAKEGFDIAIKIIPYLVAMLVAIAVFRASGAMDLVTLGLAKLVSALGLNGDFIPTVPTALMKPLSGSGSRGLMIDTMKTYGVDSFAGRVSCIIQGAADTTFYIIAVYFGSVGVRKTRYAVPCGLIADFGGVIAGIIAGYVFFH
jgi:spore maturation protein SpmA